MKEPVYLATDIGATGIKLVAAAFDGTRLEVKDSWSVKNGPIVDHGRECADIDAMLLAIQKGLQKLEPHYQCISLGIDTYGNGYGILDASGNLVMKPHHYRDKRIANIRKELHKHMTDYQFYQSTGNYPIKTRALLHLFLDALESSPHITEGKYLLPLPNLLEYLMTGEHTSEITIASVLCLLDSSGKTWNYPLFRTLGIKEELFGSLSLPGQKKGVTYKKGISIVTVAGHDTESALLAVPGLDTSKAFISMGTSFVFGARVKAPVITKESFKERYKNMRGAFGTFSLCKDVPGFWILERCMEQWKTYVPNLDYAMVCHAAQNFRENRTFLNISDDRFRVSENNILGAIHNYCIETGQKPVEGIEETSRCLFESYALYIKWSMERLSKITKVSYQSLEAMNGGVFNQLLLQMFADATEVPVIARSPWASAMGNLLLQLYAHKEIGSERELGEVALMSCTPITYESNHSSYWGECLQYMKDKGLYKEDS